MATGLVSEREVRKYEREAREMGKASFYLAWLMDEDRCGLSCNFQTCAYVCRPWGDVCGRRGGCIYLPCWCVLFLTERGNPRACLLTDQPHSRP